MSGTPLSLVSGTAYYTLIPLKAGLLITNIHVIIATAAGASVTASKVGLYDSTLNRVAISADLGTSWQSLGLKTHALTSPYVVPEQGAYYVAAFCTFTTTAPATYRHPGPTGAQGSAAIGSGLKPWGSQTGQTDLPSVAVLSGTANPPMWYGVS